MGKQDKHVLITGSTRGIGYGLAKQFIQSGCKVTINGTSDAGVEASLSKLKETTTDANVQGFAGKAESYEDMDRLWKAAIKSFGPIDIWINNAGIGQGRKLAWEMTPEEIKRIVDINVIGMMNGSHVAVNHMRKQGYGQIFNMEGFGSDGMMMKQMAYYGATKRALRYFTRSLAKELKGDKVKVGTLNPGMVITDLLTKSLKEDRDDIDKVKKIFNILADDVETVTSFLVESILKNNKNGAHIIWLTKPKMYFRFMSAPFNKRDFFKEL